jgi:hypothetical protein
LQGPLGGVLTLFPLYSLTLADDLFGCLRGSVRIGLALLWLFVRTVHGSASFQAGVILLVQDPNRKDRNGPPPVSPSPLGRPCKRLKTVYPALSHNR